ncbi:enoyl-CoA hydratase/isomerase family protein [Roseovarius sp. TE539]|uniref:enoyl-CoA hydratase/isomerase family protein n=1 Tax=Roseovarius sp. TE539 TaxID=2249812 RepID=UPI000DDDDDD1|nr:enoyl-CoA hydratase-related protein [Roseovarius sp. TE539]RBI71942.1 enoyl-CoA hydratase/isomerase family protein [Roseovarius sp. TE539]
MDRFEKYETMTFERDGRVLTVTLNLPESLNAVNAKLHSELSQVFSDLNDDPDSDVIVLTGAGRAFCAGGDIDWMQDAIDDPSCFEVTAVEAKRIIFSQLDLEKPLICRMNGHAIGLGATIALTCDVVVAADSAKIGDPHVSVGLVAGDGGAILWPQMIGYMRAKEYLLTGDPIPAEEAARMGLINRAVPEETLDEDVYALAHRLASGARKAIRWTKVTTNIGLKQLAHAAMDTGVAYESMSNVSEDHREAVAAFRDKRKPVFTGR